MYPWEPRLLQASARPNIIQNQQSEYVPTRVGGSGVFLNGGAT